MSHEAKLSTTVAAAPLQVSRRPAAPLAAAAPPAFWAPPAVVAPPDDEPPPAAVCPPDPELARTHTCERQVRPTSHVPVAVHGQLSRPGVQAPASWCVSLDVPSS